MIKILVVLLPKISDTKSITVRWRHDGDCDYEGGRDDSGLVVFHGGGDEAMTC